MILRGVVLLTFLGISKVSSYGLKEEFTWSYLNYTWPKSTADFNPEELDYIYGNNIPISAIRWNDKIFVTVPRRNPGVPSTLNYISTYIQERHNVPLTPYPDWETNNMNTPQENRLVSVYRMAIDECDRLWLADTGILEYRGNRTIIQPHSIVIIDLKTDTVIKRHWLNDTVIKPATALTFMSVDVTPGQCNDAHAYMPDLTGYGLIVYSLRKDYAWRIKHNYFYMESLVGDFKVGGFKFQWPDGVFSVTLSSIKTDGHRDMYFQSMAGTHLFSVSTEILKNEALALRNYHDNDFKIVGNRQNNQQSTGTALHQSSGIMFLALVNQNALACWNTNKPFSEAELDVVFKDDDKFVYASDVKVYKDDVIVVTNAMPVFIYGKFDYSQVNFRIWMNSVDWTTSGTKCARKHSWSHTPSYG